LRGCVRAASNVGSHVAAVSPLRAAQRLTTPEPRAANEAKPAVAIIPKPRRVIFLAIRLKILSQNEPQFQNDKSVEISPLMRFA
jgi:hypothetical protein